MTWQDFLTTLARGLEQLDARLKAAAPVLDADAGSGPATAPPPPVCLANGHQCAGTAQCLIDVGTYWTGADGDFVPVDHAGICLHDKGLTRAGVTAPPSLHRGYRAGPEPAAGPFRTVATRDRRPERA